MQKDLTIGYWAIRGIAQPIRAFAQFLEIPYNEVLYTEIDHWSKDAQDFKKPFANLPYIVDGEEVIFQSDACFYYLAQKASKPDMLGKDGKQQTQVAFARGIINDLQQIYVTYISDTDNLEKNKQAKMIEFEDYFVGFENILKQQAYIAGDSITYVDFRFWEFVDEFLIINPQTIQSKPALLQYHQRIAEIPQIKNFMSSAIYMKRE